LFGICSIVFVYFCLLYNVQLLTLLGISSYIPCFYLPYYVHLSHDLLKYNTTQSKQHLVGVPAMSFSRELSRWSDGVQLFGQRLHDTIVADVVDSQ